MKKKSEITSLTFNEFKEIHKNDTSIVALDHLHRLSLIPLYVKPDSVEEKARRFLRDKVELDLIELQTIKENNSTEDITEQITRDDLVQIIKDVYGDTEKFLDMVDDDNIPMNFTCIYEDEELYLIDNSKHRYVHWYKKTHIGRDFHTDMKSKEELIEFFKRLSKGNYTEVNYKLLKDKSE